jgi:hypothetical protein
MNPTLSLACPMKAVQLIESIPRYLLTKAVGAI